MRWFNFGENIIKWVKILFEGFELCTYSNGYMSENFKVSKGLFQGNPVAPYLFIIVIELLAEKLRQNPKVKGLKVGDEELLITMFADNLGLILDFDRKVWEATTNELDDFQNKTGLVINYDKTVVYRLGSVRNSNAKFYSSQKLHWSDNPIKVLGVVITNNHEDRLTLNYSTLMPKIENILKMWKQRDLSLFGKIMIVNSLVMSLFIYKIAVLPMIPKCFINQLDLMIKDFIWKGGKPKIPTTIILGSKENGGAGLIDLRKKELAIKCQWGYKIQTNTILLNCADTILKKPIGTILWENNLAYEDVTKIFKGNSFWHNVLHLCTKYKLELHKYNSVLEYPIWYNSQVRVGNIPIFYKTWYNVGIKRFADLYKENLELMTYVTSIK